MTYVTVNELSMYYEEHGTGEPLVLLHGGIGSSSMFQALLPDFAARRRVILVDLQGHGRTANVDRPLRPETLADDVAALLDHLGLVQADVLGYSLGGATALRLGIQHPSRVRRLVLVSIPFRRSGSYPGVIAEMEALGPEAAEMMRQSPVYAEYAENAPRPEDWVLHVTKVAELLQVDYDWTREASSITAPVMLVYADADSISPEHIVEVYRLFGGGRGDARWDGSQRPESRLAVLPGATHYDLLMNPLLAPAVTDFLEAPALVPPPMF